MEKAKMPYVEFKLMSDVQHDVQEHVDVVTLTRTQGVTQVLGEEMKQMMSLMELSNETK